MAAKMKNCPSCGRIFVPMNATQKLCPDCMDKLREKEHEVVEYVRDHPKVKIGEIIEATGASENMIKRMIREGRFIQTGVQMTYPCEKCGAPITQGKLCPKCSAALKKDLAGAAQKIQAAREAKLAERPSAYRSERTTQGGGKNNPAPAKPKKYAGDGLSNRYRGLR